MISHIVLLTEENREEFLPCIMPNVHEKVGSPTVFGFGIVASELDDPEEPAGAIVCEYDSGVATVLSVGVRPKWQRRALGGKLLQYAAEACARQNFMELSASCWVTDGVPSIVEDFFVDNGFGSLPGEAVRYAVKVGDIIGSPLERHILNAPSSPSATLVTLGQVPDAALLRFAQEFELPISIFANADPTTSCLSVANKEIISAALLSIPEDDVVEVLYLCSKTTDGRAAAAVLLHALGRLYQTAYPETTVLFAPVDETVTRLAERLLEGCKVEVMHERQLYLSLLPLWETEPDTEALISAIVKGV